MEHAGKWMIVSGTALAAIGAAVWALGRSGFRGLPGDVYYQSDRVTFYFPLAGCVLLSVLMTAAFWLWRWLKQG